ncbi:MAG TPA: serine/threonine-protein kinase [Thermoanaerobaculia bacterium]|nr:serine/threonine-protein kinase [Thermoanaerobaculia bacterium]
MPDGGGPPAPARIDHYRIVRRLALGGMAEIFLATDEKTGRRVALKKILPHLAADPDFLDRFFHEIRIQISLKHPNIVELVDCSPTPASAYIVMEYVDGGEFHGLRQETGRLPWDVALYAVDEALAGLSAAHRKGIIHRDIKPQNIMWTKDGGVKIADFGISHAEHLTRLTMTGTVVGTPAHMSPEQARGEGLDARTDLFSMGTVLFELLCGFNPFTGDSIAVTLRRVAETEPELPSLLDPTVPPAVDSFLRKLHAKDKTARFPDAEAASRSLRAVFASENVEHPALLFRTFLADPRAFVAARNRRLADESSTTAEKLLKDPAARPEEALWAAYRTVACLPHDARAQELFRTAALRAGQREKPLDNAKIRALEEALRKEPENLALLLQLAKLYRLEHDFVNLMRFFRKLQALAPPDPYTQGQISSLLADSGPAYATRAVAASVPASPRTVPGAAAQHGGARLNAALAAAAVVLVMALGIWWARRAPKLPEGRLASAAALPPAAAGRPVAPPGDETLARVLERGAAVERESGPAKAWDLYAEAAAKTARVETRIALLRAMTDLARRLGDSGRTLASLDRLAEIPAARGESLLKRGEYFESLRRDDDALRAYEDARAGPDPDAARTATLRLAQSAERGRDALRAQTLYEEILREAPDAPEALPARVGLAGLYRGAGRTRDARRLYEEILRLAPPGGDPAKSAEAALKALDAAAVAEKGEKSP